jgi:glycosyltransferase involved in cell wall biosynthesis
MALRSRARIVVVTRDGHLGDERVFLLYFVRWLRDHVSGGLEVLAWHDGPVLDRLRYAGPVRVLDDLNAWRPARVFEILRFRRIAQALKGARLRWWLLQRRSADLLYVNSLDAARILGYLRRWPMRVVVHVHSRTDVEHSDLTDVDRTVIRSHTDLFVAASDEVAELLRDEWGVPEAKVVVHQYFVAGDDGPLTSPDPPTRDGLGLDQADVVVGATGSPDWWAEPEQFVLVAWGLVRRRPDLPWRFLWLADDLDERTLWPLRHDLRNAGLDDRTTIWAGPTPFDLLAVMDLLVLSTRREAQELLVYEAAAAGVVVVATDNLTGIEDEETARVVPYLDVDALVDEVIALAEDPARRREVVARAQVAVRRHHDVSVGAPELLDRIGIAP